MKTIALSAVYRQPDTPPFRIVVRPHGGGFVCHREYLGGGYVDGIYGDLFRCLTAFADRVRDAHRDTLACGGVVTHHWQMPRKNFMWVERGGETRQIRCHAHERDILASIIRGTRRIRRGRRDWPRITRHDVRRIAAGRFG